MIMRTLKNIFPFPWQHNATFAGLILLVGMLIHEDDLLAQLAIFGILVAVYIVEVWQYHHGGTVQVLQPLVKSKTR